ncbi:MAG: MinD/ParA family protein [Butyrivibrio sp.]|nr:MinD/ParA family protein [Butyrivibrio sp.]
MDQAEKLRTIIKQQNQVNVSGTRIITVTSGKGGVGKSSVSINLALQFRREGKRVIIFDADFGLANIEVMFGVIPKYTLADIMFRGREIREIITEGPEGVMFVSGGSGIAKLVNLDHEQVKRLVHKLSELEELADVIIVDTGAGISPSVLEFVASSPEVLLVTTPEPTSITDSYALLKALAMHRDFDRDSVKINVIANKVSSSAESKAIYEKLSAVVERFLGIELIYLGDVPYDSNITRAVMKQKPVSIAYPSSKPAAALRTISERLMNGEDGEPVNKRGVSYFFGRVFESRRRK